MAFHIESPLCGEVSPVFASILTGTSLLSSPVMCSSPVRGVLLHITGDTMTLYDAVTKIIEVSGTNADPQIITEIMRKAGAPERVPDKVLKAVLAVAKILPR